MARQMIGGQEIMDLRKEGTQFDMVNVWVGDDKDTHYAKEWHKWIETVEYPEIVIEDKDNLAALDLRFVFGLTVLIQGKDPDRLLKVYEKVGKCSPSRVLLFYSNDSYVDIMDSKGLLSGIIE